MLQKSAQLEGKKTQQICARFFNQKSLANLNYFTLNERANNFTSDGESSLPYVIRNISYSHIKNVPLQEHYQFWVIQTKETTHIENKSLNGKFQLYILFFISVLWLAVYQINQKDIYMYK